jgi:glyoxylase-like metal-dependent hydrolase (beta-lactamase superfamily II)
MLNWQVGAVKITRVVEMPMSIPYDPDGFFLHDATPEALKASPWLYPHFASEDGTLLPSIHALLVETPELRLVIDTCIGNDKPRNLLNGNPLATPFLQRLAAVGWSRENVDAVVCTHLHVDHVGWNTMLVDGAWVPTFPRAVT